MPFGILVWEEKGADEMPSTIPQSAIFMGVIQIPLETVDKNLRKTAYIQAFLDFYTVFNAEFV